MDQSLERNEVVELLNRLGDADDAKALETARALHAMVITAGFNWDSLLAPDKDQDHGDQDEMDAGDEDDEDVSNKPELSQTLVEEAEKSQALLESLLGDTNISETLRDELLGYQEDIRENEFTESDAAYLATLAARLNISTPPSTD